METDSPTPEQMVVVRVSGLGVVMAGSTDDYLSRVSVLKQQLLCLCNKTGGSGLCYIVNQQHAQLHGLVEKFS